MTRRPVVKIAMPDIEPGVPLGAEPECRWVKPTDLLVDETYQRNLSERSIKLIRRITATFDWRRFKPPIVVETDDGLEVIDGQHTAIGAASNVHIAMIPVIVVDAPETKQRAAAFLGHNRDRLQITATQMHYAAVAAGDDDAVTIDQVCTRAGVRVLRYPPGNGRFEPRDTMAVVAIGALISRFGALKARQILQVLADALCTPIRAEAIRAVALLMTEGEYKDSFRPEDLTVRIRTMGEDAYAEARIFAISHKVPIWRGLAVTWFKGMRRVRRAA